jgi:hypothetical protein
MRNMSVNREHGLLDWIKRGLGLFDETHRGYYHPGFVLGFSGAWNSFRMLG